ncbi:DUF4179 domain-containing protein [Oceanirhabdus sp. W0125-5]|uniref:DUF4179 domain-containing protein n=1 Tax=Oceanirhabdus sp. W0125-5 TaxID=2999116 RepID=UPI0022F2D7D3|nr:DUF4179 domain-containing protein [Oceanirhabdus sp. W0125-5]WBW97011.1 DUF4179 domain-containing protein [Oceanirhabdus sp. W0125-5]
MLDRDKFNEDMNMKNIDNELMNALKKGVLKGKEEEKNWYKKAWVKSVAVIGVIITITIGGCLLSPTFAEGVANLPLVKEIISLFKHEKSIQAAVDNEYGGNILAECNNEDYIFRIIHGMRDKNNLVFFYEIIDKNNKLNDQNNILFFKDPKITDENGNVVVLDTGITFNVTKSNKGIFKIRKDTAAKIDNFNDIDGYIYISGRLMSNIWTSDKQFVSVELLSLDNFKVSVGELEKSKEVVKEIKKEIQVGDEEIIIDKLEIEPTEMRLSFKYNTIIEKEKIISSVEVELEDNNGVKWNKLDGDGINQEIGRSQPINVIDENGNKVPRNTVEYEFIEYVNSPYFIDFEECYLKKLKIGYHDLVENIEINIKDIKIINEYDKYFNIEDFKETDEYYKFRLVPETNRNIKISHGYGNGIGVYKIVKVDENNSYARHKYLSEGYDIKPIYSDNEIRLEEEKLNEDKGIVIYEKYEILDIRIDKKIFEENVIQNKIFITTQQDEKFIEFEGNVKIFSKEDK